MNFSHMLSHSPGDNGSKLLKICSEFLRYLSQSNQRYHPITQLFSYPTPFLWKVVIGRKNFHSTELFFLPVSSRSNIILSVTFICLYYPYRIRMLNMWDDLERSSIIPCKRAIFSVQRKLSFCLLLILIANTDLKNPQ